jgi:hypothetical protein
MSENPALIGADPELFLRGSIKDHRGRVVRYDVLRPAFGLFGGNKDAPLKMGDLADGFMYLEDNAALEFNIPPQQTADGFVEAITTAKNWLRDNKLVELGLVMADVNVMELEPKFQADPRAQEVGCSKDWDAYGREHGAIEREAFTGKSLGNQRCAGGHFHVSYNHATVPQFVAARILDLYLQLPYLEYDRQGPRRPLYGKAGLFRPKSYGLEYRTSSNWWLWREDWQRTLATSALTFARRTYENDYLKLLSDAYAGMPWADVQKAIANEDYNLGTRLVDLADRNFNLGIRQRPRRR